MTLKISRVEMWMATIDDRAGGTADMLEPLAEAGANLEFVFSRKTPEVPGKALLFVLPIRGAKLVEAALACGFIKSPNVQSVKIEGADQPGVLARVSRTVASAGLSLRALMGTTVGRRFVCFVAFESAEEAEQALGALQALATGGRRRARVGASPRRR